MPITVPVLTIERVLSYFCLALMLSRVPARPLGDVLFRTYSRESLSPQSLAAAPTGARRVMQFSTRKVKHLHCENPENQVVFSPYDAAMVTDT